MGAVTIVELSFQGNHDMHGDLYQDRFKVVRVTVIGELMGPAVVGAPVPTVEFGGRFRRDAETGYR